MSLQVASGEFVAIIGPSGAGKSTLLYLCGLLDHPTSGKIIINSVDTERLTSDERTAFRLHNLGYVFQDYALLPELTALENVMVPLLMRGLNANAASEKAEHTLEKVGLKGHSYKLPSQMSGGQQQRVSIARAIADNPKILFADEPTANLDSASSREVLETFLELHEKGQTIVMVTHEQEYAKLAKRIIELKDGQIRNGIR